MLAISTNQSVALQFTRSRCGASSPASSHRYSLAARRAAVCSLIVQSYFVHVSISACRVLIVAQPEGAQTRGANCEQLFVGGDGTQIVHNQVVYSYASHSCDACASKAHKLRYYHTHILVSLTQPYNSLKWGFVIKCVIKCALMSIKTYWSRTRQREAERRQRESWTREGELDEIEKNE